ncbi:ABC transporter permease [Nocardia cyriacigeorgica]|jgi:phospholipid/cholesterol/gamma-HCH transport system permease protein|uniref:ABC transporter permease n=1 Tax=Nocardia cyriacigeorgica TaxID=135487 RepID=UPI000CE9D7C4|nr:ABC transporter permease [Nocardia cyriacigeorgica]AVH21844.1 ABC transporter permease [Nocardia cyriacigeorgica]MBF6321353.1 ABC transporter permease [Nocardia cyriacigeorgica]PPJ09653.1 ABC transporter permease [Nocardia cyriacigeorgica]
MAATHTPPLLRPLRALGVPARVLAETGHKIFFLVRALAAIPVALRNYSREVLRLIADISWGNGTLVAGGGTAGVMLAMCAFGGMTVGIEAYTNLDLLGIGQVTGAISALGSTREIAPILATQAFIVQAGCRFTAQLGAMRVSEEIDALESIAIRPMPYLVTTRIIASVVVAIPLYVAALAVSFISTALTVAVVGDVSDGTYQHYFQIFAVPSDLFYSVLKVIVLVTLSIFIQCYYGYFATGGPEGVGVAAGRAIRLSIIVIVSANLVMSLAIWGTAVGSARLSG